MIARLLTPYLVPIAGGLAVLLVAALVTACFLFGKWQDAKDERDAALGRISTLLTAMDLDHEIRSMDDDAFNAALDERLSRDRQ